MRNHLRAAQRLWLSAMVLSVFQGAVGVYAAGDAPVHDALSELLAFDSRFDSAAISASLTATAQEQGVVGLSTVAAHIKGPGVPELSAVSGQVTPRADVRVATLAEAARLASGGQATTWNVDPAHLGQALSFRLARGAVHGPLVLKRIELSETSVSASEAERLLTAESQRRTTLRAKRLLTTTTQEQDKLLALYKQRIKWKAPRRALRKTWERLAAARKARAAAHAAWEADFAAYQSAATVALGLSDKPASAGKVSMALAMVFFEQPGGAQLSIGVPTPLQTTVAILPPLSGVAFPATERSGLWNQVADLSADAAIAAARASFGPLGQSVQLGRLWLSGSACLQLLPLCLPLLLLALIKACRRTAASYNPFTDAGPMPRLGMPVSVLNVASLVVLPTCSCLLCAWSLAALGQLPLGPAVAALACAGAGFWSHGVVRELRELLSAISRQSRPPHPTSANGDA